MSEPAYQIGCRPSKARRAFCRTRRTDARDMIWQPDTEDSPTRLQASQTTPPPTQHRRWEERACHGQRPQTIMPPARTTHFIRTPAHLMKCLRRGWLYKAHCPMGWSILRFISSRRLNTAGSLPRLSGARLPTRTSSR